jgi:hypothetical protein
MTEPKFLSLEDTLAWEPLSKALAVSKVARSGRGFLTQYKAANGDADRLDEYWRRRRMNFVKRHMAQVKKRHEPLFENGLPTRRHLALIMWAYSPQPQRLFEVASRLAG